jgi:ureidoglycolate lyase
MTELLRLHAEPLSKAAFAPFGDVIECADKEPLSINEGTTARFHDLAALDVAAGGGYALINIFRAQPRAMPIEIAMMERHPLGSQAFYPLHGQAYLLVVAAPSPAFAAGDLRAFLALGNQGVNYHRGVWHHPLLALQADQEFLVVDRGGDGDNLQEVWFEPGRGAVLQYPAS